MPGFSGLGLDIRTIFADNPTFRQKIARRAPAETPKTTVHIALVAKAAARGHIRDGHVPLPEQRLRFVYPFSGYVVARRHAGGGLEQPFEMRDAQARDARQRPGLNLVIEIFVDVIQDAPQLLRVQRRGRGLAFLFMRQRVNQEEGQGCAGMLKIIDREDRALAAVARHELADQTHDGAVMPRQFPKRAVSGLAKMFSRCVPPSQHVVVHMKPEQCRLLFPNERKVGLPVQENHALPAGGDDTAAAVLIVMPFDLRLGLFLGHHNEPVALSCYLAQTLRGQQSVKNNKSVWDNVVVLIGRVRGGFEGRHGCTGATGLMPGACLCLYSILPSSVLDLQAIFTDNPAKISNGGVRSRVF
ncbi:hypothetical protein OH491_07410 [Termitidicoccus mucosus]